MQSHGRPARFARFTISAMLPFEQGAMMYFVFRRVKPFDHVGPRLEPVPGAVHVLDVGL